MSSKRTTSHPNSASLYSEPAGKDSVRTGANQLTKGKSSRKPDWLLIFVIVLFLISLLIVWLVDVPSLLRQ